MTGWLVDRWQSPAAVLFTSGFLIALLPFVASLTGLALTLVYAQLPAYMIHQFEEHHEDCFCRYVNTLLASGKLALTPGAAFIINSVFVWGIDLLALYLARFTSLGLGLIAVDLALVNAAVHLLLAAIRREYNPGTVTAAVIFIPLGAWSYVVLLAAGATAAEQLISVGVAVLIHVGIVAHIRRRIARMGWSRATTAAR